MVADGRTRRPRRGASRRPGELDHLLLAEGTPQSRGEIVGHRRRGAVDRLGVLEDELLAVVVRVTVPPAADVVHLRDRYAGLHTFVVAEVDAPRAADRHR